MFALKTISRMQKGRASYMGFRATLRLALFFFMTWPTGYGISLVMSLLTDAYICSYSCSIFSTTQQQTFTEKVFNSTADTRAEYGIASSLHRSSKGILECYTIEL